MRQSNLNLGKIATVGFAAMVPISTALTNVMILLIFAHWLLSGQYREKVSIIWTHPIARSLCLLVLLSLGSLVYTAASPEAQYDGLRDVMKLLYFPILVWYLQDDQTKQYAIWAIILAMLFTGLIGLGKFYLDWPIGYKFSQAAVFKDHIKTNFFMAIAAFLCAHEAIRNTGVRRRLMILVVAFMLYYGFFMSIGRTGYALFALLIILFGFQNGRWRGSAVAAAALTTILIFSFCFSKPFHDRIAYIGCDFESQPQNNPGCLESEAVLSSLPTSIEIRQDFLHTTWSMIQDAPFLGGGLGSFATLYDQKSDEMGTIKTQNPHNEYLHIWSELGLVGLLAFLWFFYQQWRTSRQLPPFEKAIAEALVMAFMIGCLANSWLMDFSELNFWMLMLSIAFGWIQKQHEYKT